MGVGSDEIFGGYPEYDFIKDEKVDFDSHTIYGIV